MLERSLDHPFDIRKDALQGPKIWRVTPAPPVNATRLRQVQREIQLRRQRVSARDGRALASLEEAVLRLARLRVLSLEACSRG